MNDMSVPNAFVSLAIQIHYESGIQGADMSRITQCFNELMEAYRQERKEAKLQQNAELMEALRKALPELKESLAECGHDPSVGIDSSELIEAIESVEKALTQPHE